MRIPPQLFIFLFLFPISLLSHPSIFTYNSPQIDSSQKVSQSLNEFKQQYQFRQLFIVFAGPYPSSPSSSFGHTFILLQPLDETKSYLLWPTINFGAVTEGIHPIKQFYYGVFDTLVGTYSFLSFYEKVREYGFIESRNLYLFPVELSEREKDKFLTELYKEKDKKYAYNFVLQNCSTQLSHLFLQSFSDEIISKKTTIIEPRDLVDKEGVLRGKLKSPFLIESSENMFNKNKQAFENQIQFVDTNTILNAGYYLTFLEWKFQKKNQHLSDQENKILEKLRLITSEQNQERQNPFQHKPVSFNLHRPTLFGFGAEIKKGERVLTFSGRIGMHDWYDDQKIYPSDEFLSFGDITIYSGKKGYGISKLILFRQLSIPKNTSLTEKKSWNLEFGLFEDVSKKFVAIKSGYGKTIGLLDYFSISGMVSFSPYYSITNKIYSSHFGPELIFSIIPSSTFFSFNSLVFFDLVNSENIEIPMGWESSIAVNGFLFDIMKVDYQLTSMVSKLSIHAYFYF